MATQTTAPSPVSASDVLLETVSSVQEPSVARNPLPPQTGAARARVRLGRAATVSEGLNPSTVAIIGLFHLGAVAALFFFTWQRLAVMAILYILAINVGIGMCYHRLLTHRGYHVPKWIEYVMTWFATTALEGGPIFWVSTHRVHHQLSDREGDPHTPREGAWWAHTGWIFFGEALHSKTDVLERYSPDLSRDRFHVWMSKYHWLPITLSAVLLFSLGWLFGGWKSGVGMVLWGVTLRVTLGLHATWLVNSATHLWGSRRFETHDDSRNSWWVALLTGGEGWHNNHHAHPVSARHGLAWYEFDPHFWGIWLLARLGLAKKIQVAKFDPDDPKPAGM
jgi:stearoyl-CoA desaturase (delta-9 desaturase)